MATSGSFTTSSRSATQYPRNATFSWSQKSQSTANNETVIDWSFTLGGGSSSTASIAIYTGSITVNGTTHSFSYGGAFKKNGFVLKSGTTTIKHNDDGTKNFSASGGVNIYGSSEYYSGSGSFTLNSIPRKATVTSASNFNDEANPTIGYENKAGNSVSSLQACIAKTDGSTIVVAYRDINKTGSSYTFNLTAAERTALRNLIPNSNSTTVRMYVKTVIGSNTFYDYKEVTLSITNANPTFSNFAYQDTNSTVTNIIGSNQILVRGKSSLRVTVSSGNKAVANKSATMSNYVASISGLTASANYSTSDVTMNFSGNTFTAGTQALSVKATDSRGNSTTVSKNVTVLAYSNPTTNISAQRLNNFENQTTITVSGSFSPLTVSGTAKNTISLVEYRYKDQSTTTWGSWTTMSGLSVNSGGTFTVSNLTLSLDNTKSFDFQVRTTDKFGNYTTSAIISQGTAIFRIGTDGYVYNREQRMLSLSDIPGIKNATTQTHTDYNNNQDYVPNMRFLSFWNGAYNSGGSSNISNLAANAVKTSNITNGAITAAKLKATDSWVLLGSTHNTSAVTNGQVLSVSIPESYRQCSLKVLCKLELAANGWVDLRAYDASGNLLKHTVNLFGSFSGGTHAYGSENMNYFVATYENPGSYRCITMEATSFKYSPSGNYRDWNGRCGWGWGALAINALQANGSAVGSIRLFVGGTCQANAAMKVWGMLD